MVSDTEKRDVDDNAPAQSTQVPRPLRDRVGISIAAADATGLVDAIVEAEEAGVHQVWLTQSAASTSCYSRICLMKFDNQVR